MSLVRVTQSGPGTQYQSSASSFCDGYLASDQCDLKHSPSAFVCVHVPVEQYSKTNDVSFCF